MPSRVHRGLRATGDRAVRLSPLGSADSVAPMSSNAVCRWLLVAIALGCGDGGSGGGLQRAMFERLRVGSDFDGAVANAVSGDGRIVVGMAGPVDFHGFPVTTAVRWTGSTEMHDLGIVGRATAVSRDGSVVAGGEIFGLGGHATVVTPLVQPFLWSSATGRREIRAPGGAQHVAGVLALSALGDVVYGQVAHGGQLIAYRWEGESAFLPTIDAERIHIPTATNADGTIAVGYLGCCGDTESVAIRWDPTGVRRIPAIDGSSGCVPAELSADGDVVIGVCGRQIVRWRGDRLELLQPLPGEVYSAVEGASADAGVFVGWLQPEPERDFDARRAYIWTEEHGKRLLADVLLDAGLGSELEGLTLTSANDVSDDGRVVIGVARSSDGRSVPFRAVLP